MNDRNEERPERKFSSDRPPFKRDGQRSDRPTGDRSRSERARFERDSNGPDRARLARPGRAGEDRAKERPDWQTRVERPRGDDRPKSPMIPEEITEKDLDLLIRVQMKTLSPENAERVARHLAMVGLLINDDPELAHKHAIAAADRAGRIGVVRETLGVTAYTVGDFALALRELQAFRRISGSNDQLPLMVDSERGMGRPDKALELGRSIPREKLSADVRANLAIAMSGARLDKGQNDLALAELEIPELNPAKVFAYSPQLFRAYADTLEILGQKAESKKWFDLADRADVALAQAADSGEDLMNVIEEIEIPAPYEARAPREERKPWAPRGSDSRGSDSRDDRKPWAARGSDSRGSGSRGDRPRDDRPRDDRPRRDDSGGKPAWKKPRDR